MKSKSYLLLLLLTVLSSIIVTISVSNISVQGYEDSYSYDESYYNDKNNDESYYNDKNNDESYYNDKNNDESYYNDKNNYIPYDKKYKNPNTLVIKKELLICDEISENSTVDCSTDDFLMENPNSGKYIECNPDLCNPATPNLFGISIQDKLIVEGNTEGTNINLNKEYYYVSEDENTPHQFFDRPFSHLCQLSGFDDGFFKIIDDEPQPLEMVICTLHEGDCAGPVEGRGEEKECTVKNYIVAGGPFSES
jgi:hypothetical protein